MAYSVIYGRGGMGKSHLAIMCMVGRQEPFHLVTQDPNKAERLLRSLDALDTCKVHVAASWASLARLLRGVATEKGKRGPAPIPVGANLIVDDFSTLAGALPDKYVGAKGNTDWQSVVAVYKLMIQRISRRDALVLTHTRTFDGLHVPAAPSTGCRATLMDNATGVYPLVAYNQLLTPPSGDDPGVLATYARLYSLWEAAFASYISGDYHGVPWRSLEIVLSEEAKQRLDAEIERIYTAGEVRQGEGEDEGEDEGEGKGGKKKGKKKKKKKVKRGGAEAKLRLLKAKEATRAKVVTVFLRAHVHASAVQLRLVQGHEAWGIVMDLSGLFGFYSKTIHEGAGWLVPPHPKFLGESIQLPKGLKETLTDLNQKKISFAESGHDQKYWRSWAAYSRWSRVDPPQAAFSF